ncbi:MAG: deoxyribonuclease IV [Deinococcales bacterium]|jgi:deoxyribonuclease-4
MARLGAHVSVAGGTHKAFERGRDIGCDALQIFVKNANRWSGRPLAEDEIEAFRKAHAESGLPVVAHASYLINLASPDPEVREKSLTALADELERCDRLGVPGLVLHPGAHMREGVEAGVERVARSLDQVFAARPDFEARVLLENTAGQGSTLGADFDELGQILGRVDDPGHLGVCFDSCHAFVAGYDLRDEDGYQATLAALDGAVDLARLAAIHLNDAKHPLGSHKDRHANILDGEIGADFFARVIHDPRFAELPMVLETPLGDDGLGHKRDLETLRGL